MKNSKNNNKIYKNNGVENYGSPQNKLNIMQDNHLSYTSSNFNILEYIDSLTKKSADTRKSKIPKQNFINSEVNFDNNIDF